MIVVDTSALMAIVLDEDTASGCIAALSAEDEIVISAATVAEALIVAVKRNVEAEITSIMEGLRMEVAPVTLGFARLVAEAYRQWGKGEHPAALNFGDCFSYALAKQRGCRLLYVREDFARTDVEGVL